MNGPVIPTIPSVVTSVRLTDWQGPGKPQFTDMQLHFADGSHLQLTAEGDCCSRSYLFLNHAKLADFLDLKGSVIRSIHAVEHEVQAHYQPQLDVTDSCRRDYRYAICYRKLGEDKEVEFFLRNWSNGYYTGWMRPEWKRAIPKTPCARPLEVVFVVGLPGAGKSTWLASNANSTDSSCRVYDDDCLHRLHEIITSFRRERGIKKLFLATPLFCKRKVLQGTWETLKTTTTQLTVSIVLFRKDAELCKSRKPHLTRDIENLSPMYLDFPQCYKDMCAANRVLVINQDGDQEAAVVAEKASAVRFAPAPVPLASSLKRPWANVVGGK